MKRKRSTRAWQRRRKSGAPYYVVRLYERLAEAAIQAGHLGLVRSAVERLTDIEPRSYAKQALVDVAARHGQMELATQVEATIPPHLRVPKSEAQSAIAKGLARAGRFYEARLCCEPCRELDKLMAYTVILQEYTKRYRQIATPIRR